jgi:hypothetical protein
MKRFFSLTKRHWQPNWRIYTCLVLIALVLYNPFAGLHGGRGCLSYDKLAQNRATAGAAELQHFSPVSGPSVPANFDVHVLGAEPVTSDQEPQPGMDQREMIPSEPELLAGVWFRPPPTQ